MVLGILAPTIRTRVVPDTVVAAGIVSKAVVQDCGSRGHAIEREKSYAKGGGSASAAASSETFHAL